MANLYTQFLKLIPREVQTVGEVTRHNADGTSDLQLPSGETIRARGQTVAVGQKAFAQGGKVTGQAPDLPVFSVTV